MSAEVQHIRTPLLDIGYEKDGPAGGVPLLLLHGWPDDVRTYDGLKPALHQAGFQTIAPWLRGCGPTRFLSATTVRSGQIAALAQDALDLADALAIPRFGIIGHDWGARIAYFLASLFPQRVTQIAALSLGWNPGSLRTPGLEQAQRFWYQWFMATDRGAELVRENPIEFARYQWQTWSPPGWFGEDAFRRTARSFENADWIAITLHSYRVRWGQADGDPRYAELERSQQRVGGISVPTIVVHGAQDRCVGVDTSAAKDEHFSSAYERHVLDGVGHFPSREAPEELARLLLKFFSRAHR